MSGASEEHSIETVEDAARGTAPAAELYSPVGRFVVGADRPAFEARAIRSSGFRLTPYRPDTLLDGWEAGRFSVRGASVRGDAHRYYGIPRQDEMGLAWDEQTGLLVVAVADGVSAAPFSHLGANVACRYAVEYCLREPAVLESFDWHHLLDGCAWAVIEAAQRLHALADPDPARAEQDLATTLCVAVMTLSDSGAVVRATSVGDSGIAVLRGDEIVPLLGGKSLGPDGMISTSVVPLPRVPITPAAGEWRLELNETLLVGTDGVWDPLGDGHGSVAEFLVAALGAQLPGQTDFLRVVDFYKQTYDDDRTLVAVRLNGEDQGHIGAR